MVIWITGLSGAGKTTVSAALFDLLKPRLPELVLLDGDAIRAMFGASPDYSEAGRTIQIKRIQALAHYLAGQNLVVIVAALYAHPDLLAWNRAHLPDYFEVYIDAPLDLVRARDSKGLYEKAARGEIGDVIGVDIPWHAPKQPDLVVDARHAEPPAAIALRVARAVPRLSQALAPA
jgi:cytidine diphosphoramidate kinase